MDLVVDIMIKQKRHLGSRVKTNVFEGMSIPYAGTPGVVHLVIDIVIMHTPISGEVVQWTKQAPRT